MKRSGRDFGWWFMGTDGSYFLTRAEEEEANAAVALSEAARDAHLRLARTYRDAADKHGPQPPPARPSRPRLTVIC